MLYRYIFILDITLNRISESLRCLAPVLDVCKTENPTRDTTHGGACLEAPWPVCRKRPFTTAARRPSEGGGSELVCQKRQRCRVAESTHDVLVREDPWHGVRL